ncbi:hypothetical protein NP493_1551g00007 [Ridgeia piscesae]|uniref:SH2 domain-containing protein n=1 Tax=Ridgeia piscesae TaxID=27915 RepID=A0AAD9JYR3_RIDPI|nr:hypothetical protein NP493_1551g00007 [Ridgeia piscesae]
MLLLTLLAVSLEVRTERRRRSSLRQIETLREQRRSQLYLSFRDARSRIAQLAEEDSHHLQEEWELQEQRARTKEAEMRAIARRARQEHSVCSRNLRTESQLINTSLDFTVDPTTTATPTVPASPSHPRPQTVWPAKPANRAAVITWFQESERPRGVGINPVTQQPLPWFHGIIVRRQAEELLVNRPLGSFLVRVSERVRGYAISYRASDRCKHYLIDTLDGHYQFFGANQVVHNSLADLVCFHKKVHITKLGQELLLYPCGQNTDPPDYADLFAEQVESSQL